MMFIQQKRSIMSRFLYRNFELLEPYEGKLSSTVLRGESSRKGADLLDSSGDPDTSKTAASWFGACIFLIVAATILRSFFL
ncbi:MAG: DUF4134 domain-containing protein [Lentimicrobiaceae bacterium]|nr:DUF4134 domain-containing protein [Lentimicrobiaceae bacterium]